MTERTSSLSWISAQLAMRFSEPPSQARFNPRPPGVIRPGGATDAVLGFLRQSPPNRYFSCFELCRYTERSIKAVNHACLYLQAQGLILTVPDPRNPRYYRYAATQRS
jgi:hypothetical protein